MSLKLIFVVTRGTFFAAYLAFALTLPPDQHDCTAHNVSIYLPARIFFVASTGHWITSCVGISAGAPLGATDASR
jgi:hypothetical protein